MIFVLDQLQLNECPLVGQLRFERAPTTCNLWSDLPSLSWVEASPLRVAIPSCKINEGMGCCVIGEGVMCEVGVP
jgi:hypothetical protein